MSAAPLDGGNCSACYSPVKSSLQRHAWREAFELRAATSLARLWRRQGKRAGARELLTPISSWFTEGVRHRLKDAKALLEELS